MTKRLEAAAKTQATNDARKGVRTAAIEAAKTAGEATGPGPGAANRAQLISPAELSDLIRHIAKASLSPLRDKVGVYLSYYCALRAQEIAGLRWDRHVLDASGKVRENLFVGGDIGKRTVARTLAIPTKLREALIELRASRPEDIYVFHRRDMERGMPLTPNAVVQWFRRLYEDAGLQGCSSHSGRRTAITTFSRKIGTGNASIRDLKDFAGHASVHTTMTYIEPSQTARTVVENMYEGA